MDLFDEHTIHEVIDPDNPQRRYCLCRNPITAQRETSTRERLLVLTRDGLEKIAAYKRETTVEVLGARIGKLLAKYKMGKFIEWKIHADKNNACSREHRVTWRLNDDKIVAEQRFDGCYS